MNAGLVLKEIEMPPCSRCGVVSGKTFSTGFLRTRKPSSTLKSDVNVKFQGRFFRCFELHLRYVPRRWKIQSNSKQIYSIHDQTAFLVLSSWIQFYRSEFRFSSVTHSKQRKAYFENPTSRCIHVLSMKGVDTALCMIMMAQVGTLSQKSFLKSPPLAHAAQIVSDGT